MKQRKDFMNDAQKRAIGTASRTHANCLRLLKAAGLNPVARPGKTLSDKANKGT